MTEEEYLSSYNRSKYPCPSLTADIAVFAEDRNYLSLLIIRREGHPFMGKYALPGGFANEGEAVEETAARELFEETGVKDLPLALSGVFSRPGRDPRGWVVSCVFVSLVSLSEHRVSAGDDAASASWFTIKASEEDNGIKVLSFTHGSENIRMRYRVSQTQNILDRSPRFEIIDSGSFAFDHAQIILSSLSRLADIPDLKNRIDVISQII